MTKEVAKKEKAEVGPPVEFDYGKDAGLGFENQTAADVSIPFINLLQALSPEVQEDPTTRVEGARPGMFINSLTKELYDGRKGFLLVPVDTNHCYVEWVPRAKGGGWVGVHELDGEAVREARRSAKQFNKLQTKEGNDLIETFYVYGYVLPSMESLHPGDAVVLAFTSTKIKKYREAMSAARKSKFRPPLWANRFLVTSFPTKNKQGQPFHNVELGFPCPATEVLTAQEASLLRSKVGDEPNPLIEFGRLLNEQVRSGVARVAYESGGAEEDLPPF